jgi:ER degradation enhancer, mannosidase alpha-like 2
MFYHAFDSYMTHAFPAAELKPLSCKGGQFDLIKLPLVTLIDTLDTLVVLGDHSRFMRSINIVTTSLPDFNLDVNVSLFETNIRILGGLLSAHLMAIDPKLNIYGGIVGEKAYNNSLLYLAVDLGRRLLPAFSTATGIPFGTVNLRYGVPPKETEIASTAGIPTFTSIHVL